MKYDEQSNMPTKLINLIGLALLIIWALFSSSCSTRKVAKSETKEEIKTDQTVSEAKTDQSTTENATVKESTVIDKSESENKETILEPLQSEKPIILIDNQGKETKILNAKITIKKASTKKDVVTQEKTKDTTVINNKIQQIKKEKAITEQNIKEIDKDIERMTAFPWYWAIIVLILIIIGYLFLKK